MATTRNNGDYDDMAWKPVVKQMAKYGSAAFVGYEIKDAIEPKENYEEKVIAKIIETTKQNEDLSLSKTNALIFVVLFMILLYLIMKHILKRRTNGELMQV